MKVVSIVGARPQFIKSAVVSRAMRSTGLEEVLVHTGQHYDSNMSDVFFEEMEIPKPDYHLSIGGGTHGQNTGRMLEAIERVLLDGRPDIVLVYGDTDSTLAGALAAVKLHIPVAHVEAGLRSFNRRMPEEINRVLTDHASSFLFAPTAVAVGHLQREGIPAERIHQVGDVMLDAALFYQTKAAQQSTVLERLNLEPSSYVLATVHRAENTDQPERLQAILAGFREVARKIPVVWPVHPRTRKVLDQLSLLAYGQDEAILIEPVGYLDMVMLESHACLIATDSGGVQKEAFFFRKPCVTLRDETEWVELVELGWNTLCPPLNARAIAQTILRCLNTQGQEAVPYGVGDAGLKIARVLSTL